MRRSFQRSSSLFLSPSYASAQACFASSRTYATGSSGSSSSGSGSNRGENRANLDSQFSELFKSFNTSMKGNNNPSFTDMLKHIAQNSSIMEGLNRLASNASSLINVHDDTPARIAVTGAAGAIGYALLFRLASGQLLGPKRPIILQCLEIPQGLSAMEGVKMELADCAFPLLRGVEVTDSPERAFEGAEFAFLVGAQPRTQGMDRSELLKKNAGIFSVQGKALNKTANRDKIKTLIVGNPANTNCLITSFNAPDINPNQFSAMTRLDHNRGLAQLAERLNVNVSDIRNFIIWGNHSDTQYPDINNTTVKGQSVRQLINDDKWVSDTFIPKVAKRGAEIIKARKSSSAASAANAAIDQMRDWTLGSNGEWVSMAVYTGDRGQKIPYGVDAELYYSYPVICEGGNYKIVEGLKIDEDSQRRMNVTNDELVKERSDAGLTHRK